MSRFLFRVIHVAIYILLHYECMHEDCVVNDVCFIYLLLFFVLYLYYCQRQFN